MLPWIPELHYTNEDFLKTTSLHNIRLQGKSTSDRYCCPQGEHVEVLLIDSDTAQLRG